MVHNKVVPIALMDDGVSMDFQCVTSHASRSHQVTRCASFSARFWLSMTLTFNLLPWKLSQPGCTHAMQNVVVLQLGDRETDRQTDRRTGKTHNAVEYYAGRVAVSDRVLGTTAWDTCLLERQTIARHDHVVSAAGVRLLRFDLSAWRTRKQFCTDIATSNVTPQSPVLTIYACWSHESDSWPAGPKILCFPTQKKCAVGIHRPTCTKYGQSILRKIFKIVATRCHLTTKILRLKCTKFDFGWGSAPAPLGELTALPRPSS